MLHYDKIDISEGTDINKGKGLYERKVHHHSYFYRMNFSFWPNVWSYFLKRKNILSFKEVTIIQQLQNSVLGYE